MDTIALRRFVVAAEETRMPMVFMDATESDNPIVFANDSFLTLTGYSRDEVLDRPSAMLFPLNQEQAEAPLMECIARGERIEVLADFRAAL